MYKLREKIDELKEYAHKCRCRYDGEIENLEKRLQNLKQDIYENMEPWDRVQVARHPERPTTLDYINVLFTILLNFMGIVL